MHRHKSLVICACAVCRIQIHNLKSRVSLSYHLTYTTHVMGQICFSFDVTRGAAFSPGPRSLTGTNDTF